MNWVQYLKDNYQLTTPIDLNQVRKVADLAALSLQFEHGWLNYSVVCSKDTLHFMYTTKEGLFTALIPMQRVVERLVVKPLLEEVVLMHSESIPSYRKP